MLVWTDDKEQTATRNRSKPFLFSLAHGPPNLPQVPGISAPSLLGNAQRRKDWSPWNDDVLGQVISRQWTGGTKLVCVLLSWLGKTGNRWVREFRRAVNCRADEGNWLTWLNLQLSSADIIDMIWHEGVGLMALWPRSITHLMTRCTARCSKNTHTAAHCLWRFISSFCFQNQLQPETA